MSKNFEEAYQAEVQLNIPDLWNRIENSLPQKAIVPECAVAESAPTFVPVNHELKNKTKKKSNPYAWMKWASLAAAGLLVVIMVPAVVGLGILGFAAKDMASADGAATESCDSVAMEDIAQDAESLPESDMMYDMQESPANSMSTITGESGAQADGDYDGGVSAGADERTNEESVEEEKMEAQGYVLASNISAKVSNCSEESRNGYYRVVLEIPEESREIFQRLEAYTDGELEVWFYSEDGTLPETEEWYFVNIYETDTETGDTPGSGLVMELESGL